MGISRGADTPSMPPARKRMTITGVDFPAAMYCVDDAACFRYMAGRGT